MTDKDNLKTALDLLRTVSEDASKLPGDTAEAIDEFIETMEQPVVKVHTDTDPLNPRTENDNVGVMFCKHSRYNLGDKDAEDPFEEVAVYDLGGYTLEGDRYSEVIEMLDDWVIETRDNEEDHQRTECAYEWMYDLPETDERRLRPDIALCLPLGLYDHSGITIFHGTRSPWDSAGWDSGQVGWHYVTKAKVDEEWNGDLEAARKYLEAEVKEYDDYLRGNCWGYTIETRSGEPIDSCWGFLGDELEETGMLHSVDEKYREALKDAWERRFE